MSAQITNLTRFGDHGWAWTETTEHGTRHLSTGRDGYGLWLLGRAGDLELLRPEAFGMPAQPAKARVFAVRLAADWWGR